MTTKRIAIACQGGGINAAFTYGVLRKILERQDSLDHENAEDRFEIAGLSGTSAGALCAFMVWYGLAPKEGSSGSIDEAITALDDLWETFSAKTLGEKLINKMATNTLRLQSKGMMPELKLSPYSMIHELMMKQMEFMDLRPEFYDFTALLNTCAPKFTSIDQEHAETRLLVGAVEILSGNFRAFDSMETRAETKQNISLNAIRASGTLPELRKAEPIENALCDDGSVRTALYWDGLWSQNPPIREFFTKARTVGEKPDEVWLIRINPQERDQEPSSLEDIRDRHNELTGNISLNQELQFIQSVNNWIDQYQDFEQAYKKVTVRTIKMTRQTSNSLDLASKFDRNRGFISELRQEGEEVAETFLKSWPHEASQWPEDSVYS